jgi:hypothetical protein
MYFLPRQGVHEIYRGSRLVLRYSDFLPQTLEMFNLNPEGHVTGFLPIHRDLGPALVENMFQLISDVIVSVDPNKSLSKEDVGLLLDRDLGPSMLNRMPACITYMATVENAMKKWKNQLHLKLQLGTYRAFHNLTLRCFGVTERGDCYPTKVGLYLPLNEILPLFTSLASALYPDGVEDQFGQAIERLTPAFNKWLELKAATPPTLHRPDSSGLAKNVLVESTEPSRAFAALSRQDPVSFSPQQMHF